MIVIVVIVVIAAVIIGITGVVASGLPFFYGIVVGAIAAGGLSFLLTGWWRPVRRGDTTRSDVDRSHPEETAISRDLNENAGGSRHIRTHPSWRDRRENHTDS
jgi:hypothetical protein